LLPLLLAALTSGCVLPPPPVFVYNLDRQPLTVEGIDPQFLIESVPVIWAESRGDPDAVNPRSGTCGLYQIHPIHRARFAPYGGWQACTDPAANLQVAYGIYLEQGWRPWGR
jgi:hypothetical protein